MNGFEIKALGIADGWIPHAHTPVLGHCTRNGILSSGIETGLVSIKWYAQLKYCVWKYK